MIEPRHEIVSLDDYRQRYATYRRDKDLESSSVHPFITVWDDHESANNSHVQGALNHQEGEGDWAERKAIATPIVSNQRGCGDLSEGSLETFDLIMLDTRLEGRDSIMDIKNEARTRKTVNVGTKAKGMPVFTERPPEWKVLGNR